MADSAPLSGTSLASRPKTGAKVDEVPGKWVAGAFTTSPDLASIVGEIVAQPAWIPGNDLTIFIADVGSSKYRKLASYESATALAAVLEVRWR